MEEQHQCPLCGQYEFERYNSMDFCPVCGWFDDALYEEDPDYCGGFYTISLSEAHKPWNSCETVFENYPNPSKNLKF